MSGQSALLGHQPLQQDDVWIQDGVKASAGSYFFPEKAQPYGPPMPPDPVHQFSGGSLFATVIAMLVCDVLIVGGRLGLRAYRKNPGADDFFAAFALICAILYCTAGIYLTKSPHSCVGQHMYFCTYTQINAAYVVTYTMQALFYPLVYSAKLAVLFLFRRITGFTKGWWTTAFWIMLIVIVLFGALSFFITIFSCTPVAAHFSLLKLGQTGKAHLHCIPPKQTLQWQLAFRGFHIATDLVLLTMPIIIISRLQLALRMKLSLVILFGFGVMTCVGSVLRNYVADNDGSDTTYTGIPLALKWDFIDMGFACMCTSLPVYSTLADTIFTRTDKALAHVGKIFSSYVTKYFSTTMGSTVDGSTGNHGLSQRMQPRSDSESVSQQNLVVPHEHGHELQDVSTMNRYATRRDVGLAV